MAAKAEDTCSRILVTGANAGIGLAICKRLIDEFLSSKPESHTLHLIITTRSSRKSKDTISAIQKHATRTPSAKAASSRLSLSSYELDLCSLPQVNSAAAQILTSFPRLDALIFNAGISGWLGLNWPMAVWKVTIDPIQQTTWPTYYIGSLNLLCPPQVPSSVTSEPPLGQVFCANVFGHYLLAHLLAPLLTTSPSRPSRIVWTSSINTPATCYSPRDMQCLDTRMAYASSKRLTDVLAFTSTQPSTRASVASFFSTPDAARHPRQYVAQPGIVSTDIMPLPWIVARAKDLSFYMARWMGSPWHTIKPRTGACSAVWLALAAQSTLDGLEGKDGKGKWGSATDRWGEERVLRTEVEGWGFGGVVGAETRFGKTARRRGVANLTEEEKEKFEELGTVSWEQMEELRREWMGRLEKPDTNQMG